MLLVVLKPSKATAVLLLVSVEEYVIEVYVITEWKVSHIWVQILVLTISYSETLVLYFYLKNESKIPILLEFCNIISNIVYKVLNH